MRDEFFDDTSPALDDARRLGDAALATTGVGLGAVVAHAMSLEFPHLLRSLTGIPCPGYGVTRPAEAMLHLELVEAFATDPIGATLLVVLGALTTLGLLRRVGVELRLPTGSWRIVRLGLAVALALRWAGTLTGVVTFVG